MVTIDELKELDKSISRALDKIRISDLKKELTKMSVDIANPDFWDDNIVAQKISKQHANLEKRIQFWESLTSKSKELIELANLSDDSLKTEIHQQYIELEKLFNNAKRELQFSGQYDSSDVILSIYAGAGGTDAQDWAEMLMRMYTRWSEENSLSVSIIDKSSGDEAGIKSVTLEISDGLFLFGKLKSENGVHRLVRLSPFNADNLRQTSFAKVEIVPKVSSPTEVEIDDKDLKIDVYRSGGKGGQSVNTTDSAVRITHIPTGIVVAIQNERSQTQNKETAMTIIRSKLAILKLEQHKDKISELKGPNEQASWGNQIRNYVMHPYSMVKDTRTKHETTEIQNVLDGDINEFIEAYLDIIIS